MIVLLVRTPFVASGSWWKKYQVLADLHGGGLRRYQELIVLEYEEIRQQVYFKKECMEGDKSYFNILKLEASKFVQLALVELCSVWVCRCDHSCTITIFQSLTYVMGRGGLNKFASCHMSLAPWTCFQTSYKKNGQNNEKLWQYISRLFCSIASLSGRNCRRFDSYVEEFKSKKLN